MNVTKLGSIAAETAKSPMPVICIPTTLSGAEFQAFFGVRDIEASHKDPHPEAGLVSRIVFLDGEIAATTPVALWLQTGVKSLDDCLFRYCGAAAGEPAADALQVIAISGLLKGLQAGIDPGADPGARQDQLYNLWLSTHPAPRRQPAAYRPWFSFAFRHSFGGVTGLAHGLGSCVSLVGSLRFHATETADRQARLAQLLAADGALREDNSLADALAAWLQRLGVVTRLRDAGVDRPVIDTVLDLVLAEAPALGPRPIVQAACQLLW